MWWAEIIVIFHNYLEVYIEMYLKNAFERDK